MLFPLKNREHLEKLEELASLKNQVEEVRLQDKLGKQNFHENIKEVFETVFDTIKKTSENITKTMMLTSRENNKALESLNDKLLEIMNDGGIKASYLLSPLSIKFTNPENASQYKQVKDFNSNRANDLLVHNTIPITLYINLLTFPDTGN